MKLPHTRDPEFAKPTGQDKKKRNRAKTRTEKEEVRDVWRKRKRQDKNRSSCEEEIKTKRRQK